MSAIETLSDVNNTFLARRELTCNFNGLGGKLKKLEAIDMISKEYKLDGKVIIPIRLQNHVGKTLVTGTFFVYEDEELAKKHVNPTIIKRLDKAKTAEEKPAEAVEEKPAEAVEEKPAEAVEEKPAEAVEEKPAEAVEEKPAEAVEEEKKE